MAILGAFTNADIWVAQTDLSNYVNEVTVEADAVPLDATTFGSGGWVANVGGLRSGKVDIKGYWSSATTVDPDPLIQPLLGTNANPVTIIPQTAVVANPCYFGTFLAPSYKTGGKVGDLLSFETNPIADAPIVRGQVANTTALITTGTTTILNLGTTPTANQAVYCNLHVVTVSGTGGPSMTAVLQGSTVVGFGSPATIATSSAITSASSVKLKGATGTTANQYYRLSVTISGSTPSFLLYAAIGIA